MSAELTGNLAELTAFQPFTAQRISNYWLKWTQGVMIGGHATKKLLERAYNTFEQSQYQTLATLSFLHLYNLSHSQGYQKRRRRSQKHKQDKCLLANGINLNPTASLTIFVLIPCTNET
jgi:hypothetical protein